MPAFTSQYTPEQREAFISAALDRNMPGKRVSELAAAGELTTPDGTKLDPFSVPANTVASAKRNAKKRRMGKSVSQLAQAEPRDAIEALRRRLINVADAELKHLERQKIGSRDPERLRQIGRCVREFGAIPGPKEARKPAPGTKRNGEREQGDTKGGLAGDLLKAHRTQTATSGKGKPRHDDATHEEHGHIGAQETQHEEHAEQEDATGNGAHGSPARVLAASVLGARDMVASSPA